MAATATPRLPKVVTDLVRDSSRPAEAPVSTRTRAPVAAGSEGRPDKLLSRLPISDVGASPAAAPGLPVR